MNEEQAKALRKPFPTTAIGKLPRGNIELDFVGHAAVTDRLLQVDPQWTWAPFTADELAALPEPLRNKGLWINLTVCGVTRPGFGDGTGADFVKIAIGDAIRNAAMRFGVALDLWTREELHPANDEHRALVKDTVTVDSGRVSRGTVEDDPWQTPDPPLRTPEENAALERASNERGMRIVGGAATKKQIGMLGALMSERDMHDREAALIWVNDVIAPEGPVASRSDLTKLQASKLIEALQAMPIPRDANYAGD